MKFRVERDVLAEAVAWAARTPPGPAAVPVLAGLLLDAAAEQPGSVELRLRGLGPGRARRRTSTSEAPSSSPAGCWPTSPAACPPARSTISTDGARVSVTCGSTRVHPADAAGRRLPGAARHADRTGTVARRRLRRRPSRQVAIAAGRDDTLPVLTGVRVEIEGDRITLVATDRYRLAVRELRWKPEHAGHLGESPWSRARTLPDTAKSLDRGAAVLHRAGLRRRRRRRA